MATITRCMDINEYERLSNITHNKIQKEALIAGSIFHSHSRIGNNKNNSFPKMSVKRYLACS
jgi:hypothetical protein